MPLVTELLRETIKGLKLKAIEKANHKHYLRVGIDYEGWFGCHKKYHVICAAYDCGMKEEITQKQFDAARAAGIEFQMYRDD